jgi:pimeloyl-ACP methyl ester carboxylesterase
MTSTISSADEASLTSMKLSGVELEVIRRGAGRPILFLHPEIGIASNLPVLDYLAAHGQLIAPSHPGFMRSSLPRHFSNIDDLAYFYLDLLETLDLRDVVVVGSSLGAWVAAEMGIKSCERISHFVLISPVGIKVGGPLDSSVVDVFVTDSEDFKGLAFADPSKAPPEATRVSDEEAEVIARNREATALYGWLPYMYDPKLRARLYRIKARTLIVKGDQDGLISDAYVAQFVESIPGAQFTVVADAGHFPHLEQPEQLVKRILAFIENRTS